MTHPAHTAGSDGILVGERPHPRGWGTFPRYLGVYVRELGVLSLEECVRKMTSLPAQRLGLADRGLLRPGMAADVVVLRPRDGPRHRHLRGSAPARGGFRTCWSTASSWSTTASTRALAGRALRGA